MWQSVQLGREMAPYALPTLETRRGCQRNSLVSNRDSLLAMSKPIRERWKSIPPSIWHTACLIAVTNCWLSNAVQFSLWLQQLARQRPYFPVRELFS